MKRVLAWCVMLALWVQALPGRTTPDHWNPALSPPYFASAGDAKSIPSNVIMALTQDARGLLWVGSQHGLLRYDGYRWRKFGHSATDPHSSPNDFINALLATSDGKLWVGSGGALARFDPASEQFERFERDPARPASIRAGGVLALAADARGGLWVGMTAGLDYLPPGSHDFVHYGPDGPPVIALLIDRQQGRWMARPGSLQYWPAEQTGQAAQAGQTFHAPANALADATAWLSGAQIQSLFQASDGQIWIGSDKRGAARFNPETGRWQALTQGAPTGIAQAPIRQFAQADPNHIWIATLGDGIQIVGAHDGKLWQHLRRDAALPGSLALDSIGAMLTAPDGMLWLGTWGSGMQRVNMAYTSHPAVPAFRLLRHSPAQPRGLSSANVRSVLERHDGRILVAVMGNGIDILDPQQGLLGGYRPVARGTDPAYPALPDGNVFAMAETPDGSLWVCTSQSGLLRLPAGHKQWQSVPDLADAQGRSLYLAHDGSLWLATRRGLVQWQAEQQRFRLYPTHDGRALQGYVFAFAEDARHGLWASGTDGLLLLPHGADKVQQITHEPTRRDSLSAGLVHGLVLDQSGALWVSTDQGLDRLRGWDGQRAQFEHMSAQLGYPGRGIGGNLQLDGQGRIWSNRAVLDWQRRRIFDLSGADGYEVGTQWLGAVGRTRGGLLLYGGTDGLALIQPGQFQPRPNRSPGVVTALEINGKPVAPGALAAVGPPANAVGLTLNPQQRNFSIEFATLDYANPGQNRYQYRLQGYDPDWIEADAEHRSAHYGNLWPGAYQLQVRGSDHHGQFDGAPLHIPIRVLPAVWQTGWFAVLATLGLFGAGFGLHRWRTRRLKGLIAQGTATIAAAHEKLASSHAELAGIHQELVESHRHLQETQAQLVQSEKMASLGQLVANIAHEINTPIGAVKASGSNIADALEQTLAGLPQLIQNLSGEDRVRFFRLLDEARRPHKVLGSRAERAAVKTVRGQLEQHGLEAAQQTAAILVQLHIHELSEELASVLLPLLRHPQAAFILRSANDIASIINNTANINLAVARVSKIVFALKAYSHHSNSGAMIPASLREGLETVLTLYQSQIGKGIELVCQFEEIAPLLCLPDELAQVWTNLIQNALQAMAQPASAHAGEHGDTPADAQPVTHTGTHTLTLRLWCADGCARVLMQDTGCGIDAAIRARIFDAFFTTKAMGEGSGLGLNIVKKIVDKHHGTIEVQSTPGVGTSFVVSLPYSVLPYDNKMQNI
jgi:signal transduction histidine kinase/ligand-binding sensor domain-containing protein